MLTAFSVKRAPPNHKNKAANESRIFGAFISGTVIRGHENLAVEVHGEAGIFRGESAPPIDTINFSRNEKEEQSNKKLDWESISPAISSCGDKLGKFNLVVHRKKFHKKVVLNVLALGLLKKHSWYNGEERLKEMIAIHALPVDAVCRLRETFDKLNYGGNDRIETRDWLESVNEPKEPMPLSRFRRRKSPRNIRVPGRGVAATCLCGIVPRLGPPRSRLGGISTSPAAAAPRLVSAEPPPRNVHVAAAASPRLMSTEYPRPRRGVAGTRRRGTASAECPRRGRVAATPPLGISTSSAAAMPEPASRPGT